MIDGYFDNFSTQTFTGQMMSTHDDDNDRPCEQALTNSLVLENVFKCLPTEFLLSTCSLVNKFWNNEARTFVRDHRKCTVAAAHRRAAITLCGLLQNLDQICLEILVNGRIVPINSLVLDCLMWGECNCSVYAYAAVEEWRILGLRNNLKLLHMEISGHCQWQCREHKPLLLLLRHNSNQVRSLKIDDIKSFAEVIGSTDWDPDFLELREINISVFRDLIFPGKFIPTEATLAIVRKIVNCGPQLGRIIVLDVETLRMIPEDKYKLLEEFSFEVFQHEDATLYEKIIELRPTLEVLTICPPRCHTPARFKRNGDGLADLELKHKFDSTLERLLQTFHQSLKTICIDGMYELGQLCHPPLTNLSKFAVLYSNDAQMFFRLVSSIDYPNSMPRLEEVEFEVNSVEWPPGSLHTDVILGSSKTVRKMTLTVSSDAADLSVFVPLFPDISSLVIKTSRRVHGEPSVLSSSFLAKIWELWPLVEELEVTGHGRQLKNSFDSQFCGIQPEEVDLLKGKDEEYLKSVNIVPTGHSILNMKRLRELRIRLCFDRPDEDTHSLQHDHKFISKVTELVAFRWMPHATIWVRWTLRNRASWVETDRCLYHQSPTRVWFSAITLDRMQKLDVELKLAELGKVCRTPTDYFNADGPGPSNKGGRSSLETQYGSKGVRKLTLELQRKKINMTFLKSYAPNVASMEIRGSRSNQLKGDSVPFSIIFQFWPELEELRITRADFFLHRSYDADLCGIHEEEAELLRKMNPEFLRNVRIVPIKPSLLTMPRLRSLQIESGSGDHLKPHASKYRKYFRSKVAELIAFRRMPYLDVYVSVRFS